MRGHNICFNAEIWKIIPKLSPLSFLIWSKEVVKKVCSTNPQNIATHARLTISVYIFLHFDINAMMNYI